MVKRTLKLALMLTIMLGVQALALDMTCMMLWHDSPVEFYGIADHHPESSENHQDADDGHEASGDIEASLAHIESASSGELVTDLDDGATFSSHYTLNLLLEFPFLDDGDPPKSTALV